MWKLIYNFAQILSLTRIPQQLIKWIDYLNFLNILLLTME